MPILLSLILIFQVTACRKSDDRNNDDSDNQNNDGINMPGVSDDFDIDNYIYLPNELNTDSLDGLRYLINGAFAHSEYIIYWYHDFSDVIIVKLTPDGVPGHEIRFPGLDRLYDVKGLTVTSDNNYEMVIAIPDGDDGMTFNYLIFDEQGNEVSNLLLFNIPLYFSTFTSLEHVVISNNNIVVTIKSGDFQTVHLFTTDGEKTGELSVTGLKGVVQLRDNHVAALFTRGASSSLREIDFKTASWGEAHQLTIGNAEQIFSAESTPYYDFFINAGDSLIGYVLETNTHTVLINWLESGIVISSQYHIGMLENKDVFVLQSENISVQGRFDVLTDLNILSRTLRSDYNQQRKIITIGGRFFSRDLRIEIAKFNAESRDYQLEIRDYSEGLGFEEGIIRMNVELMTGRGPDIIVKDLNNNTDFFADLYTFIDADHELDRKDFFPNILQTMESPAGKLPFIANTFMIRTMIAKRETAERLTPFTVDSIFHNLDDTDPHGFAGSWLNGISFLDIIIFSTDGLIDWDSRQANFNYEYFISRLEIAARLPDSLPGGSMDEEYRRLRVGEQLLMSLRINDVNEFRIARARIGDIVAVGEPTLSGGHNIVSVSDSIGIYTKSQNQDAAWSFIRRLLLTEADTDTSTSGLPLRIDKFEELLLEAMAQEFYDYDAPQFGIVSGEEMPKFHVGGETLLGTPIFAMTEEEALEIRSIIDSTVVGSRPDLTVRMIVMEEFQSFSNGLRSAADTARIIQNRVQTYLNEQG